MRRVCNFSVAAWFWLLLASVPAYAGMQIAAGAPEGFEQMDAPRATAVTLAYGGDVLGVFPAHFSPGKLSFDHPEAIAAAIPSLIDPTALIATLRQPMPAHADLLCGTRHPDGCGHLTPDVAGVIFDEAHLRAELFVNKTQLSAVADESSFYLPLPERQLSSVAALNGSVSGVDQAAPTFALTNQAIMSFGEAKLNTQTTASNQGLRFDEAAASVERMGWNGTGGLFRSQPMQLLSDRDIGGVSVSTSRKTLLDEHKTEGNDILLYLPRRAFVSILREGRLYSSQAYEAGNQHIDTSELPDGAYEITLRIQEADGETREERRFFVKAQQLPPPTSPTYYLQAGMIRKPAGSDATLPQLTSNPILRAGTVQRITDSLGLNFGGLGVSDRAAFEPGLFWLNDGAQITGTALTSTRGDVGAQAGFIKNLESLNLAADVRKLWMSDKALPGFDDMARKITQATASVAYVFNTNMTLGLRGSYSRESGSVTTASVGPYADWRLWQVGEDSLEITADAARISNHYEGSSFLHFAHRFGNYGITTTTGGNYGGGITGPAGNARIWHDDTTPGNALLVGAGVSGDTKARTASADADWRNDVGQLRGGVQESVGASNSFSYGGNFAVNMAQLADEVHVGGNEVDSSAVVVATNGDASTDMKIFVNGVERSSVTVGHQQVIYLTPFHSYVLRIAPAHNGLFDYDANERKITLYPGNVTKLQWTVNSFYVVTAKIVRTDGQPLKNAVLQESRAQVTTDERGRLQTEMAKPTALTFALDDQSSCRVDLPAMAAVNGVLLYRTPLVCADDGAKAAPVQKERMVVSLPSQTE